MFSVTLLKNTTHPPAKKCLFCKSSEVFNNELKITKLTLSGGSDGKQSACNTGGPGSIPGSGRSPRKGNGNPFQYSCLENSMHRWAWWDTVHGVTKSQTQMSNQHTHIYNPLITVVFFFLVTYSHNHQRLLKHKYIYININYKLGDLSY